MTGTGTQADPYIVSDWADFITAVGTSGAYVEFPKNLVKTTDTAVDPNKLYVDGNGSVQTNVQPSNLANLYENTFVLDANDYFPEGVTSTISMVCASLNGFGGTIKNLSSNTSGIDIISKPSYVNIEGIAFLNVRCTSCYFINGDYSSAWGTVSKCLFSGRADGTNSRAFIRQDRMYFSSCAFNVELYDTAAFCQDTRNSNLICMNYCRININDKRVTSSDVEQFCISRSYFTGNFNRYIWLSMYPAYDHTVFDVDCASIHAENSSIGEKMFVNSDKCADVGGVAVTTEELKNASALAAKGFPIQT